MDFLDKILYCSEIKLESIFCYQIKAINGQRGQSLLSYQPYTYHFQHDSHLEVKYFQTFLCYTQQITEVNQISNNKNNNKVKSDFQNEKKI